MFSIVDLINLAASLSGVTDAATKIKGRLQRLSPNELYINLLDAQFKNERLHSKLDLRLDKSKTKVAMRQASINLKTESLLPPALDQSILKQMVNILLHPGVVTGSTSIDKNRAELIITRVHLQYFEEIKKQMPELVDLLQHEQIQSQFGAIIANQETSEESIAGVGRQVAELQNNLATKEQFENFQQQMLAQVQKLISGNQTNYRVAAIPIISDQPPYPGEIYAHRSRLINQLIDLISEKRWVSLTGEPGIGKTFLASAVYLALESHNPKWISFVSYEGDRGNEHFVDQLKLWFGELKNETFDNLANLSTQELLAELAMVTPNSILILDNIPDHNELQNRGFYELLLNIIGQLTILSDIKVISTSQRPLPTKLKNSFDVFELPAPVFSNDDIQEVLQRANAKPYFLKEEIISYIQASTEGNAALVSAYVMWYKRQNWETNSEFIESIFSGVPGESVREEHQRKILQLLPQDIRELLLRLSLLISQFPFEIVTALAAVPQILTHPGLLFNEIKDIWVKSLGNQRYQVSPLMKGIGKQNLSEETQEMVFSVAADYYLQHQPITVPDDLLPLTMYLWSSKRFQEYVNIVIRVLIEINETKKGKYVDFLTEVPSPSIGIPDTVALSSQIVLRAQQVRVRILADLSFTELDEDLEKLILKAGESETTAIIYAYMATSIFLAGFPSEIKIPSGAALTRFFKALDLIYQHPDIDVFKVNLPVNDPENQVDPYPFKIEDGVWFLAHRVNSQENTLQFLETVYSTKETVLKRVFENELASQSMPYLMDQLWLKEDNKPESEQDWQTIIDVCDHALEFAFNYNLAPLIVAATRAKAIVLSKIDRNTSRASQLLEQLIDIQDNDLRTWINITLGFLHNDFGLAQDACNYFEAILNISCTTAEHWQFNIQKHLIPLYSKLDQPIEAKQISKKVLSDKVFGSASYASKLEILGELAFIHWGLKDYKRSCATLYVFFKLLMNKKSYLSQDEFNEIYNKFSNALSWYFKQISPALKSIEGDNVPVEAGYFTKSYPKLRQYEREDGNTVSKLAVPIFQLAITANLHRLAWHLIQKVENDNELNRTAFLHLIRHHMAAITSRFGTPRQALQEGIFAFKFKAYATTTSYSVNALQGISLDGAWDRLSSNEKASYEAFLLYDVFTPLILETLILKLSKNATITIFQSYREAMISFQVLQSYSNLLGLINYLEKINLLRFSSVTDINEHTGNEILDCLTLLSIYEYRKDLSLVDKLGVQIHVMEQFWSKRYEIAIEQVIYNLGILFHRFWTNIGKNQAFLLSNPAYVKSTLSKISPRMGKLTIASIFDCIIRDLNVRLNQTTASVIKQLYE